MGIASLYTITMKLQTIIGLCAIHLAATSPTGYPVAQTKQGAVRGTHLSDAVDGFLGVPYARPPIGDRRFKPPQPLEEGNNSLDASKFGAVCYQFHYNTVMLDNFKETTPESEDCLNLNVFVPRSRSDKELLPALVWMHGGAFGEGGGSMRGICCFRSIVVWLSRSAYNPTNLVASQNDIVVVTLK
jgi:carboxylesterase type B